MARFAYTAINHNGKTVKGTVTAESPFSARKHLRAKGIHPTGIKQAPREEQSASIKRIFKKNSKAQVTEFTRQLSTMLNSGIKLTEAISVLVQQLSDEEFKHAITDLRDRVISGESFADILGEYPQYFDVIYVNMVRVGEVTGTLSESLATIADFMEKRRRVESKMFTAMIYPMILITACTIAVFILTVFILPKIIEQIPTKELPWITEAMMKTSEVMRSPWALAIFGGIAVIITAYKKFVKTPRGARIRDKFLLSLPMFGPLIRQRIIARFASTLSTLLGSGLSMAESLKIVAQVSGNTIMADAITRSRERILSGADIATPLRDSGVIDPTIAHMVTVGEKSGELEQMLMSISQNLESNSDVVIERLSAALEPVIIVGLVIVVGLVVFATILPILQYSSQI
ncbi:General secretion pathway protein F [Anaerohalosphaera lusitana]|uniref:General secretion pathway protein F n=1 Tax=Anaerohalosphaera lusitana TaxID=1936003 RepID=A0A1U9NPA8_9BACT|nr:type II secretion system F family protein [Anaerohalosphaera lusitana]AQT69637.1 General secretion pathway protein F [Anaerohalosphaera lusitana]